MTKQVVMNLLLAILLVLVTAQTWRIHQLGLTCERLEMQLTTVQTEVAQGSLHVEGGTRAAPADADKGPSSSQGSGKSSSGNGKRGDLAQLRTADFIASTIVLRDNPAMALTPEQLAKVNGLLDECERLYQSRLETTKTLDEKSGHFTEVLQAAQTTFLEKNRSELELKREEMRMQLTRGREEASVFAQARDFLKQTRAQ